MNDIVIPEITIGFWELPTAALIMMAFLISGMVISNKREWLKKNLWRKEAAYWILGTVSFALFLPAIWEIGKIVTGHSDVFDKDPRGYAILLAAIVGTPFIIWRTYIAQKQSYTSEQGLITDRIAKAIEHLGTDKTVTEGGDTHSKPNLEVRLGAIYSLERIAQDSLRDHVQIMEILCAYVRENSPTSSEHPYPEEANDDFEKLDEWGKQIGPIRIDIQSVIDVIGRRNEQQILKEGKYQLDLRNCNLRRVNFGAGLFDGAQLDKSQMDWAKMGEVKLNGAELNWAELNRAWLIGAELIGAELIGAELNRAWLNRAEINGANFVAAHTNLTAVKSTDLSVAINISEDQIKSMFGDKSTTLPYGMELPDNWPTEDFGFGEFYQHWAAAKE